MFEATEIERKVRNKSTYWYAMILSSCRTPDHYLSLALQRLAWDSLGIKSV